MVLKIFHNANTYIYKNIDSTFCVTHSYGGMKSLQFDIQIKHPVYPYLREETRLEYDGQYYLIKGVSERSSAGISTINAELDLTGLESKIYESKTWTTESFYNFTADILSGTGWRIIDADLVSKRTTTEAQDQTPLQLLNHSTNSTSYGTCYQFDTKNHLITCIKPENNTSPTGCYFTDELNLSEITFKGSSSGLVTKLYPIGKDGLTIKSVNNGKDYIENYSYTNKVVCLIWRDERYTNAQSLYDDSVVKLAAMARPERSYTCKVIDLAKTNPEIYGNILNFKLYDVITLIDRVRNSRVDHRIIEVKEYPGNHSLDTVTLSSIAGRVTGKLSELNSRVTELDAQQLHNRTKINEIKQDLDSTVLHVSESWANSENRSTITQTAEGLFFDVSKIIGAEQWSTKLQLSSNDVRIAWNNISKYIQFESGELRIYDSAVASTQKLRSKFNDSGMHFYRDDTYVGTIGTNQWTGNSSHKGLIFDLDSSGKYMAFAQKASASDSMYTTMLCFSRANSIYTDYGMHLGCNLYAHNYTVKDVRLDGISVNYSGTNYNGYTGTIPIVTSVTITSNSNGGISWNISESKLRVSNGIIVGYWN